MATKDGLGFDGTRHWPYDTSPERCQCVMSHSTLVEGEWTQCNGIRDHRSNRFCTGCEESHGDKKEKGK